MFVLAVISQKGGSGKTTVAQNLATQAAANGHSVALVDLDSQPTSANWGDRRQSDDVAVVSAQIARLKAVLKTAKQQGCSFVVLDTPPKIADAALESAKCADLVLVPVRPLVNDLETLRTLRDVLRFAGDPPTFVVVNQAPGRGPRHLEAGRVAEGWGFEVCPVVLRQRSDFGDAPAEGLSVVEFNSSGKAASEVRALYSFVEGHNNSKFLKPASNA